MMLSLATAALASAGAAPLPVSAGTLPSLFISACLDGSARMSAGEAERIEFDALPDALRSRLGKPSGGKIWKLRSGGQSFLYLLDYPDSSSPKICGLASDDLSLRSGTAAIEARLTGRALPASAVRSTEWLKASDGYKALATRTGGYTIMQINWLQTAVAEVPRTP